MPWRFEEMPATGRCTEERKQEFYQATPTVRDDEQNDYTLSKLR